MDPARLPHAPRIPSRLTRRPLAGRRPLDGVAEPADEGSLATLAERGKELFRPRGPSEYARRSSASSRSLHSTRW